MNNSLAQYLVSNELLRYQENSLLRIEMIKILNEFKIKGVIDTNKLNETKLPEVIKKHTGIVIKFMSTEKDDYDGAIRIPPITKNMVLRPDIMRENLTAIGFDDIKKHIKNFEATINVKTCRVSGFFSQLGAVVLLGNAYWYKDSYFTVEETVAVILHELGHFFCYCLYLIETVRVNSVLSALNRSGFYDCPKDKKIQILGELEKGADIKIRDKETLVGASEEVVLSVVISSSLNKIRSETNMPLFDDRTFEFLADHFATVHGAGKDLATMLAKFSKAVYRTAGTQDQQQRMNVLTFFGNLTTTIFKREVISAITCMFLGASKPNLYDSPNTRLNKIKEQLTAQLRNQKLSLKIKMIILTDIEAIENLLKMSHEISTFTEFFYFTVIPWGRKKKKISELQHDYETLASNPMYKISAQLTI